MKQGYEKVENDKQETWLSLFRNMQLERFNFLSGISATGI